ncbi:MAG: Tryptophan synthase alpha chain [bacterium]|nr:Tryptophan synthase alpha chain [bacterium]
MSELLKAFQRMRGKGRTALAPYFMAGYPNLDTGFALIRAACACGADMIELGMPFSDPLADGPTIQRAGQRALQNPFTLRQLLDRLGEEKSAIPIPVVVMTYYNPVLQLGLRETASLAAKAGLSGFIVPDLPLEESGPMDSACREVGVDLVPLIAPTTSPERIRRIDSASTGILYYVSRLGITGARQDLPAGLLKSLDRYRANTTHPSVVGFGISTPEHAGSLKGHTDGIVIASALIDRLERSVPEAYTETVREFLEPISKVLG